MHSFVTSGLIVLFGCFCIWIILRPAIALAAPAKPLLKVLFAALFGLCVLILGALFSGAKAVYELCRRA